MTKWTAADAAGFVDRVQRIDYEKGWADGVEEILNQLEGRSILSPQGVYRGPVPDELLTWIAGVRRRLETV